MNVRLKLFFFALGATIVPNLTSAAAVKSMSLEVFNDGATRFWEVSVSCEAVSQPRSMRRPINDEQWCSSDVKNLCHKNKFSLSRELCSDGFNQQIANLQSVKTQAPSQTKVETAPTPETAVVAPKASKATQVSSQVVSRESLRKEQIQIEEQRILIRQKRLELRRRELSLQKRQLSVN